MRRFSLPASGRLPQDTSSGGSSGSCSPTQSRTRPFGANRAPRALQISAESRRAREVITSMLSGRPVGSGSWTLTSRQRQGKAARRAAAARKAHFFSRASASVISSPGAAAARRRGGRGGRFPGGGGEVPPRRPRSDQIRPPVPERQLAVVGEQGVD